MPLLENNSELHTVCLIHVSAFHGLLSSITSKKGEIAKTESCTCQNVIH